MTFFLIQGILLFFVLALLIVLSMVWPPDSPWAPWWRTSKKLARRICVFGGITKEDIVYELGSGEANILTVAAKEFGANCVGIEIDPFRAWLSKSTLRKEGITDKVRIETKDFFASNLSPATVIFCYLIPKTLRLLMPKFYKELKPGTRIITYRYNLNMPLVTYDKKYGLYMYKIPKVKSKARKKI